MDQAIERPGTSSGGNCTRPFLFNLRRCV